MDALQDELVRLERSALDRWIRLDPDGYLGLYAENVVYFDPMTEHRVDGLEAMRKRLAPMKNLKAPFTNPRYDMLDPRTDKFGDVALLTFHLVNYGTLGDGREQVLARWNASELYRQSDGSWKIVHSHWSYTQPELKGPAEPQKPTER